MFVCVKCVSENEEVDKVDVWLCVCACVGVFFFVKVCVCVRVCGGGVVRELSEVCLCSQQLRHTQTNTNTCRRVPALTKTPVAL